MTGLPADLRERAAEAKRKAELVLGPHRLVTLKAKRMLAHDPIASPRPRLLEEERAGTWDEAKHPRGKTTAESTPGSFAPAEATQNAAQQAAGQKTGGQKLFKPSKDLAENAKRITEVLNGKTLRNDNYRYCVGQLVKEAKAFAAAMGTTASQHTLDMLQMKIGESFYLQGLLVQAKGKDASAYFSKAKQMGWMPAGAAAVPPPPAPPPVPAQSKPAGSPDSTWTKVGPQKGSNPGGTYKDANGKDWYVKTPKTEDHVKQDILANRLYMIAGAKVPEEIQTKLDGKPALASKMLPMGAIELGGANPDTKPGYYKSLQEHFAVDAWLGNRDVIGLNEDNVLLSMGDAYRVDQGGALQYRAQGEKKEFGSVVTEWKSLRDPSVNPQTAKVFGGMTPQQQIASIDKVLAITDGQIKGEVSAMGLPASLASTLISRKQHLAGIKTALLSELDEPPATLPPVPKPNVVQADIEKAKKTTSFPTPPGADPALSKVVADFNAKYAGKTITEQAALEAKAVEFKEMKGQVDAFKLKAQAEQEAKAKEQAEKAASTVLSDYGDPDDPLTSKEHYAVLASLKLLGSQPSDYLANVKNKLDSMAKNGKPLNITPLQATYIRAYTGSHYRPVNTALRAGAITEEQFNYARILSDSLKKLPEYKGTTYRGADLTAKQADLYQPGHIVFERGFTSTSKAEHSSFSGSYRLVIESRTGRDVSSLSQHSHEQEVLFDFNSVFRVTKREGSTIYLSEVG